MLIILANSGEIVVFDALRLVLVKCSLNSRRLTTGEGSNFGGEGAINGLNGTSNGNNGIDDDEIAYTIRELTASLRMSPSIDSMQVLYLYMLAVYF